MDKKFEVFATMLTNIRYEVVSFSEQEAMKKAEKMFKYDKDILLDDSSLQGDIISENSRIDDAIEYVENKKFYINYKKKYKK